MGKSPNAFRTISEVAEWLDTQAHVLRFWESKFSQVKPVKRAGGRRYYRPADMLLLGGIKKLLHDDGMTIKGAQKLLRDKGIKHVSALSQPLDDEEATVTADPVPIEEQPPQEAGTILTFQQPAQPRETTAADDGAVLEQEDLDDMVGDLFASLAQAPADAVSPAPEASAPDLPDLAGAVADSALEDTTEEQDDPAVEDIISAELATGVSSEEDVVPEEGPSDVPETDPEQPSDIAAAPTVPEPTAEDTEGTAAEQTPSHEPRDSFLPILGSTRSIVPDQEQELAAVLQQMVEWRSRILQRENA